MLIHLIDCQTAIECRHVWGSRKPRREQEDIWETVLCAMPKVIKRLFGAAAVSSLFVFSFGAEIIDNASFKRWCNSSVFKEKEIARQKNLLTPTAFLLISSPTDSETSRWRLTRWCLTEQFANKHFQYKLPDDRIDLSSPNKGTGNKSSVAKCNDQPPLK